MKKTDENSIEDSDGGAGGRTVARGCVLSGGRPLDAHPAGAFGVAPSNLPVRCLGGHGGNVNVLVNFRGISDQASILHLVDETKQLSCVDCVFAGLFFRVGFLQVAFKSISIGRDLAQITQAGSTKSDMPMFQKDRIGITGSPTVNSPRFLPL